MTVDDTRDDENTGQANDEEPERHRGGRLALLSLLLAAFLAAVVLIVWLFTSSSPKSTGDPGGHTTPTSSASPHPKTHVDITVTPQNPDVQLAVHDIAFNPPITAPGDTSTAELVIANTGDTPYYLTVSALLLDHDIDFGPYMDASLVAAGSCDAAPRQALYTGRADLLQATLADAVTPGGTVELCMRMTAQFGIPDGYQNRVGQVSLSFTASQLPTPARGKSTTRETP